MVYFGTVMFDTNVYCRLSLDSKKSFRLGIHDAPVSCVEYSCVAGTCLISLACSLLRTSAIAHCAVKLKFLESIASLSKSCSCLMRLVKLRALSI